MNLDYSLELVKMLTKMQLLLVPVQVQALQMVPAALVQAQKMEFQHQAQVMDHLQIQTLKVLKVYTAAAQLKLMILAKELIILKQEKLIKYHKLIITKLCHQSCIIY